MTTTEGDLIAYGIIVSESGPVHGESSSSIIPNKETKGIVMCENLLSTVPYRAYFDLQQKPDGSVTFRGMLRTSQNMDDEDKMIISVNSGQEFDIDFESSYRKDDEKEKLFQYWHPCYVINEETVAK